MVCEDFESNFGRGVEGGYGFLDGLGDGTVVEGAAEEVVDEGFRGDGGRDPEGEEEGLGFRRAFPVVALEAGCAEGEGGDGDDVAGGHPLEDGGGGGAAKREKC